MFCWLGWCECGFRANNNDLNPYLYMILAVFTIKTWTHGALI
jgi:hypothetical protein